MLAIFALEHPKTVKFYVTLGFPIKRKIRIKSKYEILRSKSIQLKHESFLCTHFAMGTGEKL